MFQIDTVALDGEYLVRALLERVRRGGRLVLGPVDQNDLTYKQVSSGGGVRCGAGVESSSVDVANSVTNILLKAGSSVGKVG